MLDIGIKLNEWLSSASINTSSSSSKPTETDTKSDNVQTSESNNTDVKETKVESTVPWKANVVEMPVAMGPQYIVDNYREHREGGFYYDHRIIIPEMPEKYTVKPFATRKTGGNHPDTGFSLRIRIVFSHSIDLGRKEYRRVGGGLKKTWLWVDLMRRGPKSGPPLVERVLRIMNSDCHTAKVALIGHGNTLRYILATENLKVGDLIKTSGEIPKNPGTSSSV